jgi:hypothetical protein
LEYLKVNKGYFIRIKRDKTSKKEEKELQGIQNQKIQQEKEPILNIPLDNDKDAKQTLHQVRVESSLPLTCGGKVLYTGRYGACEHKFETSSFIPRSTEPDSWLCSTAICFRY